MITQTLKNLYLQELQKLRTEIELYTHEERIWVIDKNIANSGGNLCLHLVGNLNTYIGCELGKFDYVRNRDLEFSLKNVPKKELLRMIDETITILNKTFNGIKDEQLDQEYPLLVWKEKTSVFYLLTRLLSHLSYHLGQVNYHRRLLN
jgi:hypothetical protein